MRLILIAFIMACFTYQSSAQTLQSAFSIDAHTGYTTNTQLTPYVGAWDTTSTGPYTLVAPSGQVNLLLKRGTVSGFGGLLYQPFLNQRTSWRGAYGILQYQHNFSFAWQGGASAGIKSVTSNYTQNMTWFQVFMNWNINPFLQLRFQAGQSYRSYLNSSVTPDTHEHFTTYGTGLDYWLASGWRLSASINGDLLHPLQPQKDFDTGIRITKFWANQAWIGLFGNWGQFENSLLVQSSLGGSTPVIPAGFIHSQLLQTGIMGEWPLTDNISITGRLTSLHRTSSNLNSPENDIQGSLGLRFSFYPKLPGSKNRVYPKWRQDHGTFYFVANYRGKGHLFIVGDFNDWSKPGIQLIHKSGNTYAARLHLKPGVYEYKILKIVHNSEEWARLSKSTPEVSDGFGGSNGRFIVSGLQQ